MCACMYVCIYIDAYIWKCVCVCMSTYTHTYTHKRTYMCVCVFVLISLGHLLNRTSPYHLTPSLRPPERLLTCVCNTKECQHEGTATCRTKAHCYSQRWDQRDDSQPIVRGCMAAGYVGLICKLYYVGYVILESTSYVLSMYVVL